MLTIQTLGEFSMSYNGKTISEKSRRSKKMWTLLKYMITFRDRDISQNEMIELLWPGSESENPTAALKTQLHRLRTTLSALDMPESEEIIINSMGTYAFNNSLQYSIDIVELDNLYKMSNQPELSEKEQTAYLRRAFDLYKGDFLHIMKDEAWVTPINLYYHSLFLKIADRLIEILYKHKQFSDLTVVCKKTILIDNYCELAHRVLIQMLIENKELQTAREHYQYVVDLFYNQHGKNPTTELTSLYEEIIKSETSFEMNLDVIKTNLAENSEEKGAFFCELEFFKHVYRLQLRDCERKRQPVHLCLITVKDFGTAVEKQNISKVMQQIFSSISQSLRISDIFARYSAAQFIILLPGTNNETAELILQRIIRRYKADNVGNIYKLDYRFVKAGL